MLFNIVCVISENASKIDPLISLKMSCQFSFKNRFVVSPNTLSPLNKLLKCAYILWKFMEFLVNKVCWRNTKMSKAYFVILKVIRRSSVYKWTFPFFSFDLPVNLTRSSGLSSVKLLCPWPWIGNTRIWPRIEYGPTNTNCGPFNLNS